MPVGRVVSGGQTGVDRAALDAAAELELPHGGWCPAGGLAEDLTEPPGLLARYPGLRETESADPSVRTARNVRDSDATLVLVTGGRRSPGTDLTLDCCRQQGRPHLVVDLDEPGASETVREWLRRLGDEITLNVAGPRESEAPGVYDAARALLREVLGPSRPT